MSTEEFAGISLALGVVRGVRSFRVDKLGRLTGINFPQVWVPGENVAECRKSETGWLGSGYYTSILTGATSLTPPSMNPYSASLDAIYKALTGQTYPSTPTPGRGSSRRNGKGTIAAMVPPDTSRLPQVDSMENCLHGFYAYYDGSNDYHDQGEVTGVIEGYGETLIGTRGFRSMKARIVALRIHNEATGRLGAVVARNYSGIPQFATFEEMVAKFPPDGGENSIAPDTDPDFWTRHA